jgi:hypothetical protein
MSTRAVASECNVNVSTISHLQHCFREFVYTSNWHYNCRPLQPRTSTSSFFSCGIVWDLQLGQPMKQRACTTRRISAQTVRNVLREAHLRACRPHQGLEPTAVRRRNRFQWANAHLQWSLAHWRSVLFNCTGQMADCLACMTLCGRAVCWCQCCKLSAPWWRWGYGMGRHERSTTNRIAFYQWQFECTEIP